MARSTSGALLFVVFAIAAVLGTAHGISYTIGALAGSPKLRTNYFTCIRLGCKLTVEAAAAAPSPMSPSAAGPSVAMPPSSSSAASAGIAASLAGLGLSAVVLTAF